jgi:hypothetical protein
MQQCTDQSCPLCVPSCLQLCCEGSPLSRQLLESAIEKGAVFTVHVSRILPALMLAPKLLDGGARMRRSINVDCNNMSKFGLTLGRQPPYPDKPPPLTPRHADGLPRVR